MEKCSVANLLRHLRASKGSGELKDRDRKVRAEADVAEMEAAKMAGSLVEVAVVQADLATRISNTRARLLQVPVKAALRLEDGMPVAAREELIRLEIHEALEELAGRG